MSHTIRKATMDDLDELEGILKAYFAESIYKKLTYRSEGTREMISNWLQGETLVAVKENKIVGFAAMSIFRTFYEENEADVEMFYVCKECRGTGISRHMISILKEIKDHCQAKVMYSSCLGGVSGENNQIYVNLWKKFNFDVLGTVLVEI